MLKRIALISGSFYGQIMGGAEYQQFLLGRRLKDSGHQVFYVFVDNNNPIKADSEFELIKMRKRALLKKLLGRCFFMDFFKLQKYLAFVKPDVVVIRGGFAYAGIAAEYCLHHESKLIWQIASRKDLEPFRFSMKRTIAFDYIDKKLLKHGIKKADRIIGQAQYQDDLLSKNYGRRCDAIISNYHPLPNDRIEKKSPVCIVWVANFKQLKRPELFVRLAREFHNRPDIKFVMIGKNSSHSYSRRISEEIGQAENIDFRGELPIEEVNRILSSSHVLVNTSTLEGFPNTFIQAWMRKVPVVSLSVDPDDIIKKNKIGFHSMNFDQMIKDISLLISDSALREEMGERAQRFAFQNFSMRNLDKIIELIES